MLLGPAIAFLVAHRLENGFRPYDKLALVCVWSVPFVARAVAGATLIPVGVIGVAALFLLVALRAYPASGRVTSPSQRDVSRSRNGEMAARTRP
jgi:hypothetical protein